ncbi:MAG: SEC-C metal-binding domain-containing protein [Solirubrobacteraceae bacterium]
MPGPGRNQPCPCGSARKTKHCCGQQRGPSEEQLAHAHLATLAHDAIHDLSHLSDEALEILWENLFELPTIDLTLHVKLPELPTPELQRLHDAVADDDPDRGWDELRAVTEQIDTPQQRARLADAILQLRDQRRLTRTQAAYAIYHLSTRSQHLLAASVTHTIAVTVGANRTPGGLRIAA